MPPDVADLSDDEIAKMMGSLLEQLGQVGAPVLARVTRYCAVDPHLSTLLCEDSRTPLSTLLFLAVSFVVLRVTKRVRLTAAHDDVPGI